MSESTYKIAGAGIGLAAAYIIHRKAGINGTWAKLALYGVATVAGYYAGMKVSDMVATGKELEPQPSDATPPADMTTNV